MAAISKDSTLLEVAALVSEALDRAGIRATLSGGSAVSIYTENRYQSQDLDFVTAAMVDELAPALAPLGFRHSPGVRIAQFTHPLVEWYLEFPASPLTFGTLQADHEECAEIPLSIGTLRIITPTQSVMDRLVAAFEWSDPQSREQASLVAAHSDIEWDALKAWFADQGYPETEFEQFRLAVAAIRGSDGERSDSD